MRKVRTFEVQVQELAEALRIQFAETTRLQQRVFAQAESMLRFRKSGMWCRKRPEEMVGPFEPITSESWIHMLCVGSVCLRPH